jgi:hypothetical protein
MALKPNQLQVTTINAQANAIIERVHKVVNGPHAQIIWLGKNHENLEQQEDNPFDYFLQLTVWLQATRSTYHTTLQAIPWQLVVGRDMIHNIAFRAKWDRIKKENRTW